MSAMERIHKEIEQLPSLRWTILQFLGTWSEFDNQRQLHLLDQKCDILLASSAQNPDISRYDCIILRGGFSYGDYLRTGIMAALHPVLDQVRNMASEGKPVIGICNGFQILCEAGLLGETALMRNKSLKFQCQDVYLRVEQTDSIFTRELTVGQVLKLPISHGEGNFRVGSGKLDELEKRGLVVFRYCDKEGNITNEANPNGSWNNIAGIMNPEGNMLGLMPHPERACESILGSTDGNLIIKSAIKTYGRDLCTRGN